MKVQDITLAKVIQYEGEEGHARLGLETYLARYKKPMVLKKGDELYVGSDMVTLRDEPQVLADLFVWYARKDRAPKPIFLLELLSSLGTLSALNDLTNVGLLENTRRNGKPIDKKDREAVLDRSVAFIRLVDLRWDEFTPKRGEEIARMVSARKAMTQKQKR